MVKPAPGMWAEAVEVVERTQKAAAEVAGLQEAIEKCKKQVGG